MRAVIAIVGRAGFMGCNLHSHTGPLTLVYFSAVTVLIMIQT